MNAPFASVAVDYHRGGLNPFPCGGEDGKRPMVRGWQKRRRIETVEKLVERFPRENVGIPTGIGTGLTVIDCDDRDLAGEMIRRCGDTPLMTSTPRDGLHLFYRHNGEKTLTRLDGAKVDIRGAGGLVIAPPSIRPDSGKSYAHRLGDWRDLPHLPPVNPGSLPLAGAKSPISENADWSVRVDEGQRNTALFRRLREIGNTVSNTDELTYYAREINRDYFPPLPEAEVVRTVASVWRYREQGRLVAPGDGGCAFLSAAALNLLHGENDAIALLALLQSHHAARKDPFFLDPEASTATFGMSRRRIRSARDVLIERGLLIPVNKGGKGNGRSTYRLPSAS